MEDDFFSANASTIAEYHKRLEKARANDDPSRKRIAAIQSLLADIASNPTNYDICKNFISEYGTTFLSSMKSDPDRNTSSVIIYCGKIAYERALRTNSVSPHMAPALNWFIPTTGKNLSEAEWQEIQITWPALQRQIIEDQVEQKGKYIEHIIAECKNDIALLTQLQEKSEEIVHSAEERLEAYKANANRIETAYNFAGLHEAFRGMATQKRNEVEDAEKRARLRAIFAVLPFFLPILLAVISFKDITPDIAMEQFLKVVGERAVFGAFVILPLVGVLLYFFRISYMEHRSLSAVLLQLEHRQSICTFIQNYAEFTGDRSKLEKFEALIFGGITPDPGAVPSTFDGIEQFAKVIEAVKKG